MKKDRCLNVVLMHVNNLIMNDPDTVKVQARKQFCVPHNYAKDILGNLSRGIRLAWCTMSLQKAPMPLNWVLRIICICKGKT